MKQLVCVLFLLFIGTELCAADFNAEQFRYRCPLIPGGSVDLPAALKLPDDILQYSSSSLADIRIIDQDGNETPYVMYAQARPMSEPEGFVWEVRGFLDRPDQQIVILKQRGDSRAFTDLRLSINAVDFYKDVSVYGLDAAQNWNELTRDVIYDFSSRLNLRKDVVRIPRSNSAFLKLILQDHASAENPPARDKDLDFSTAVTKGQSLKIEAFVSTVPHPGQAPAPSDEMHLKQPHAKQDQDGNTLISLGYVSASVEEISLRVNTANFYRALEVLQAPKDEDLAYTTLTRGAIWHIPGESAARTSVAVSLKSGAYLRLKIINQKNPPLAVAALRLRWAPRVLYFIPLRGFNYTLYTGAPALTAPRYDASLLLTREDPMLNKAAIWRSGPLTRNPDYSGSGPAKRSPPWGKLLFYGLVILLCAILGGCVLSLRRQDRLPAPPRKHRK